MRRRANLDKPKIRAHIPELSAIEYAKKYRHCMYCEREFKSLRGVHKHMAKHEHE